VSGVQKSDPRWFIYLTNWSFLLLTIAMAGLALISILLQAKRETMSSEIALGEAPQDIRSHSETSDAERAPQAQSNANQTESKSLAWYEKGKIRQFISI
jgi:DMSO reductase anchor subunit